MLLLIASEVNTNANNPYVSLKNGITNFFSNTKNLIWAGLAAFFLAAGGIGLLYNQYKKEMQEDEDKKQSDDKDSTIHVSTHDIELLKSLRINPNSELLGSTKNTQPIELIKKYLPSIKITQTEKENTEFFQNILCDIYFISHLLKNLSEGYEKNQKKISFVNFFIYDFYLELIKYIEQNMTQDIKKVHTKTDNNSKNFINFFNQEKYCYIPLNNKEDSYYTYNFTSNIFDINQIDIYSNEAMTVTKNLDEACFFSILENIKKRSEDSDIKTIMTETKKKKSEFEEKYSNIMNRNKTYTTAIKNDLAQQTTTLNKLTFINNNFNDWLTELPLNQKVLQLARENRINEGNRRLMETGIFD